MKHVLEVCLIALTTGTLVASAAAQSPPIKKGISVELVPTHNASPMPKSVVCHSASASSTEQMKVRSSTRATSLGSVRAQNELGFSVGSSGTSAPAATSSVVSVRHSCGDPSHQTTRSGVVSSATSRTQLSRAACRVGASLSISLAVMVMDFSLEGRR